ncbi:MAG: DNA-directed RNA polymerase subunit B'' [Candidatus Woesearchaeota archaeon]|jgi:DNA-directed RNA polymerase beta subunit|nr:DNA-directed RNA polymerase subunit B'' [Candidatus Woesearchaeota archaeon]
MEYKELLKSYFKDNSIVESQIRSYNYFIEKRLKEIIMKFDRSNIPEYLLEVYDEVNLKIEDARLGSPVHIEVDGSITHLTPAVARLRGLTYSAPLYLTVSTLIGSQKDEFEVQIAKMPIMLKSDKCVLNGKSQDELIGLGEDPFEPGGYFIISGTEKVVVLIEDLALNKFFIDDIEAIEPLGRMFSERGVYKSLQEIKRLKDGSYIYTFGNFKNIPIFLLIKALGITKDKDIVELTEVTDSDVIFQMSGYSTITTNEEAIEFLSKKFNLVGSSKEKGDRVSFYLENFVLPHVGTSIDDRETKAKLICKLFKKYYKITNKQASLDDKDHFANKKVKLVGQLFEQLFVGNFNDLIVDILTNFQRMIKRGRFSSMKIIIREQLLTQKINSALAIGTWSDGRRGVAQYLKRENFFDMLSHLTRVVSPLSTSQENFNARELHPTHYGKLCPVETPEGHSIGLRKNLSLLATTTYESIDTEVIVEKLKSLGMNK